MSAPPLLSPTTRHLFAATRAFAVSPVGLRKVADFVGSQDTTFEQSLSNLAHSYMRDKIPSLAPYEVGFQLLDKNEDSTRAEGLMGFNAGNEWFYVPIFYMNGQLKGHELMYVKSRDKFVPCKDGQVNLFLNKKPLRLGEGIGRQAYQRGMPPADLQIFSTPPTSYFKRSEYLAPTLIGPEFKEAVAAWCHWKRVSAVSDRKYGKTASLDLHAFLKSAGVGYTRTLIEWMRQSPELAESYQKLYGQTKLAELVSHHKRATDCGVMSKTPPTPTPKKIKPRANGVMGPAKTAEQPRVKQARVYTLDDHKIRLDRLNHTQKAALLRERILVVDDRADNEVSKAFLFKVGAIETGLPATSPKPSPTAPLASADDRVRTDDGLTNPDQTGVYNVLVKPGTFEKCLVLMKPVSSAGPQDFCVVVRLEGERDYVNAHPSRVWVSNRGVNEALDGVPTEESRFAKWYGDSGEKADSLPSSDGTYVLVGPRGQATCPFEVSDDLGEGDGYKTYSVYFRDHSSLRRDPALPRVGRGYSNAPHQFYERIKLTGKDGASLAVLGGEVLVPNGFRVLKVREPDPDSSTSGVMCSPCNDTYSRVQEPLRLGTSADLWLMIVNKEATLKVSHAGSEVTLEGSGKRANLHPSAALSALVLEHGFREQTARDLLKRASREKVCRFIVKYADGYPLQQMGPTAPAFPEPQMSSDPMFSGTGIQGMPHQEQFLPVQGMPPGPPRVPMSAPPGPEVTMVAQQAAQRGQKEVFDAAMIGSLLRQHSDETMIDQHVRPMSDFVDRCGRMLFSFYAHNDEFADRFGKQDLPELEEMLRQNFDSSGDLVLYLQQKSVKPFMDEGDIGVGVDPAEASRT